MAVDPLTEREREVVRLVARGLRNVDAAMSLGISVFTVGKHLENIYLKLNIHSRRELVAQAQRFGIV